MSPAHHIFHDPSGRRRKFVKLLLILFVLGILSVMYLAHRLFHQFSNLPVIEQLQDTAHELETQRNKKISKALLKNVRTELDREIHETELLAKRLKIPPRETRVWGIYEPDNESAYYSFQSHASQVTDLVLTTFNLSSNGDGIEFPKINSTADTQAKDTVTNAIKRGTRLYGRLTNDSVDGYIPEPVIKLIESADARSNVIRSVVLGAQASKLSGLIIDFRNLDKPLYFKLLPFFAELHEAWANAGNGNSLGITFQAAESDMPLWKFGELFDVVLMRSFGERARKDVAGPVASATWFNKAFQFALSNIPAEKLVILLDNSAYDWAEGERLGDARTYLSALRKAKEIYESNPAAANTLTFDEATFNSTFGYMDDSGRAHRVWLSDAVNSYNQYSQAFHAGIKQSGVWSLGTEDPGVWSFLGLHPDAEQARFGLKDITFPYSIQIEGRGDVLMPLSDVKSGSRELHFDSERKLITQSKYIKYPSAVVIGRRGFKPNTVALTFDDGPVEPFTPDILDILDAEQVKATFFVIGKHVQERPDLLRRIYKSGHDIGNHTYSHPELALVSEQRELLELNSTQRLVQSILGRSLILFRPPYISEGSPTSLEEARVIKTAADQNYITVGLSTDAQDWELYRKDFAGNEVRRTGQDLADEVLGDLSHIQGNVVLFHDGPNDREATVEAVRIIIPELKRRGYKLASLSELLDVPREQLLPEVDNHELLLGGLSRAYIELGYIIRTGLELVFILVAVFGVLRLLSFISLSYLSLKRERPYDAETEGFKPPVTIIIAAYNESKVINRTIKSLLASDYEEFEIIVVDDGSTDDTSEVVKREYPNHPRVSLITKENGGKSSALNVGLAAAKYEIIIGLDADTQYSSNAIGAMARHFVDPKVGAVAGNVKVGNRDSWLLQCQSIEYITNQNFGRRAFSIADAITVVPGAAGAWRKKAIEEVGMYLSDTLGEDMELTWRVRMAGYSILFEPLAIAYTEAPHTLAGVFKQRFRWMYGQFQILWKHREVFFNSDYKWFGWFGAPLVLMDDIFLILSPIADLQAIVSIVSFCLFVSNSSEMSMEALANAGPMALLIKTLVVYIIFFGAEVLCTIFAFKLDKEPLRPIWLLFVKQFFYRQLVYIVTYKAVWRALTGWRQKWGVLQRTGTVEVKTS